MTERNRKTITLFSTCVDSKLNSDKYTLKEKANIFVDALEEVFDECPKENKTASELKRYKETMIASFVAILFKKVVSENVDSSPKVYYVKTKEIVDLLFFVCTIEKEVNLTRIFNQFIQKTQGVYRWSFAIFASITEMHNLIEGSEAQYGQIDSVIDKNFIKFLNNSHEEDLLVLLNSLGERVRREFWKDKLISFVKNGNFSDIINPYYVLEKNVIDACPELAEYVFEGILKTTLACKGSWYPILKILTEMADYGEEHSIKFNVREEVPEIIFNTVMRGDGDELNKVMEILINRFGCDDETATVYLKEVTLKVAPTIFAYFELEKLKSLIKNDVFFEVVKTQKKLCELLDLEEGQ